MRRRVLAVGFAIGLGSAALTAQERGPWSVSAYAGLASQFDAGSSPSGTYAFDVTIAHRLNRSLTLGVEVGVDRFDVNTSVEQGYFHIDATSDPIFSRTCPTPCSDVAGTLSSRRTDGTIHVGPVLRFEPSSRRTWQPFVEFGLGAYQLRSTSEYTRRDLNGALIPAAFVPPQGRRWRPGASGGVGLSYFPGNGRVGIGLAGRVRAAVDPGNDYFGGTVYGLLQLGVTIR